MTDAEDLHAQMASSTDPARLDREASYRAGTRKLCDMPADGPWTMVRALDDLVAVSAEHGAYRLVIEANGGDLTARWEKIAVPLSRRRNR